MSLKIIIAGALAFVSSVALAAPASAGTYMIPAHSTKMITINATRDFHLTAKGFDGTDLDFRLISPVGRTVFEDTDGTSWTRSYVEIDSQGQYRFYVQNVGDEANAVELDVVDAG